MATYIGNLYPQSPLRVIRVGVGPPASLAMSAMPPNADVSGHQANLPAVASDCFAQASSRP
jgi:hypothetical protein